MKNVAYYEHFSARECGARIANTISPRTLKVKLIKLCAVGVGITFIYDASNVAPETKMDRSKTTIATIAPAMQTLAKVFVGQEWPLMS